MLGFNFNMFGTAQPKGGGVPSDMVLLYAPTVCPDLRWERINLEKRR
jgi:hypothetical protein